MKITQDDLDQYELELANFKVRIANKRRLLAEILLSVFNDGIEATDKKFTEEFDREESMDAPNKPGYYRANND